MNKAEGESERVIAARFFIQIETCTTSKPSSNSQFGRTGELNY